MSQLNEVTRLTSYCCTLAESPLWLAQSNQLLFVDIHQGQLLCCDSLGQMQHSFDFEKEVGAVVHCCEQYLVVASGCTLYQFDRQSLQCIVLLEVAGDDQNLRFNDAKVDPFGNLWIGTMERSETQPRACLYRISAELEVSIILEDVIVSNGLDWDLERGYMYYVDSPRQRLMRYNIDFSCGRLSDPQVIYELTNSDVFPDGLCLDNSGFIWLALWGGSGLIRIDPQSKQKVQYLALPVAQVTSCAFGGSDFSTLYITTAAVNKEQGKKGPLGAGAIYCYTPEIGGRAPNAFAMPIKYDDQKMSNDN
ncbi:SMP-30/gluconolactonase/LRE family protein [Gammaproteobacteria bacterium AS21]